MLRHSVHFAAAIKQNCLAQPGYPSTMISMCVPVIEIQTNIDVFQTFFKYYSFMSDDQYKSFYDMAKTTNNLLDNSIKLLPSFSTVQNKFNNYVSDVKTVPVCISPTKFGVRRDLLDIWYKILFNPKYRERIPWRVDTHGDLILYTGNTIDGVPITKDIFELIATFQIIGVNTSSCNNKLLMKDRFIHPVFIGICEETYEDVRTVFDPILNIMLVLNKTKLIDPVSFRKINPLSFIIGDMVSQTNIRGRSSQKTARPVPSHKQHVDQLRNHRHHFPITAGRAGAEVDFFIYV